MNEVEAGEAVREDGQGGVGQGGSGGSKSEAGPDGSKLCARDGVCFLASSRGNPVFLVCVWAVEPSPNRDCLPLGVGKARAI